MNKTKKEEDIFNFKLTRAANNGAESDGEFSWLFEQSELEPSYAV